MPRRDAKPQGTAEAPRSRFRPPFGGPGALVAAEHPSDGYERFMLDTAAARQIVWQATVAITAAEDRGTSFEEEFQVSHPGHAVDPVEDPVLILVAAARQIEECAESVLRRVGNWSVRQGAGS